MISKFDALFLSVHPDVHSRYTRMEGLCTPGYTLPVHPGKQRNITSWNKD
ncbi:hypothetical protein [Bacteroides sedimenti]